LNGTPGKFIILPTIGIGDLLMFTPGLRVLRERFPESEIHVFTMSRASRDAILNNPDADRVLYHPLMDDWRGGVLFVLGLRREGYDVSIQVFPGNKKEYNIVSRVIAARRRLGHRYLSHNLRALGFLNQERVDQESELHGVFENLKLLGLLGIDYDRGEIEKQGLHYYPTDAERAWADGIIAREGGAPNIGFHPGSSSRRTNRFRRWPLRNFTRLAQSLLSRYPEARLFVFGGPEEDYLKLVIREGVSEPRKVNIVSEGLRETAALVERMDIFCGNDSALLHLSAALKVPTVGIYGPSFVDRVYPFGVPHRIIRLDRDCSPCYEYTPLPLFCLAGRDYACIRNIKMEIVRDAVDDLMEQNVPKNRLNR